MSLRSFDRLFGLFLVVVLALAVMAGADRASGAGGGGDANPDAPIYVRLAPISVTIFRNDQPAGLYTAALTLQIARDGQRDIVSAAMSRLRDAMLRQLHVMIEREEKTGSPVKVGAVKDAMRAIARRELGRDVVVDLYVHTVLRKGA